MAKGVKAAVQQAASDKEKIGSSRWRATEKSNDKYGGYVLSHSTPHNNPVWAEIYPPAHKLNFGTMFRFAIAKS
jgi:hypothetical protein